MNLLLVTQKVDKEDPVLGFFHKWIEELSKKFKSIKIICLEEGEHSLPENVQVFSLGKLKKVASSQYLASRVRYVWNFYKYIWRLRKEYDAVFVHMNQEYVLLGGMFWKVFGKKIYFWRNHPKGNFLTRIAVAFSEKVFCASDSAFTAKFGKTEVMPVGIDTSIFNLESRILNLESRKRNILFLGRMDRIKRPELLIEALNILNKQGVDFVSNFYGDPTPGTQDFYDNLKNKVSSLNLSQKINFYKGVPNYKTPDIYSQHRVFVNLTPSGSMDKTILESVACGCIPVVVNNFFREIFDPNMIVKEDAKDVSNKIKFWLEASEEKVKQDSERLQKYVLENHSLNALIEKLNTEIGK